MIKALLIGIVAGIFFGVETTADSQISILNQCGYDLWIGQAANSGFSPLSGTGVSSTGQLLNGQTATYPIPQGGWGGRFFPKVGCDDSGNNCESGSSLPPCPTGGCEPPAETKVEFFYPADTTGSPYYDVSLVDGYTIPVTIVPSQTGGSCVTTTCDVSIDDCPQNEINGLGDLRAGPDGKYTMCLSPCKKWNYPAPYGKGQSETIQPGLDFCCPTPPVTVEQCRAGSVVQTEYVKLLRSKCPTAYSYAYDDEGGNHNCPSGTSFSVTFC